MKEIKAIIRPSHLNRIRDAFREMPGFPGMTVSRVEGCSAHSGPERHDAIREELAAFTGKIRVEIVAPDDKLEDILVILREGAHTGQTGDGVLWVTDVLEFVRLNAKA